MENRIKTATHLLNLLKYSRTYLPTLFSWLRETINNFLVTKTMQSNGSNDINTIIDRFN